MPALMENQAFVFARIRKLAPGADADGEFDPKEREAWLDRLWAAVKDLAPTFNSLKAAVLHQRLQFDRRRGIYDKARFTEYLKLPRRAGYMNPNYLEKADAARHPVDLNMNAGELLAGAGPIANDEPLVRDFLLHLLVDEAAWEPWAVWLRDTWLKPVFAEAKIVAGVGDPEKWASLLSPTAFQALKDRVDIDFAPDNAPFIAPGDDVSLALTVKNVPKLLVKIYEVNALNFFLTQRRQLNTDLNLDGLVANSEQTHDLTADEGRSPFRRVARTFKFADLKGKRGAWVIEFIGGGKSSRALVRKGQWHLVQQTGPAGDQITVLDETYSPVKDAVVWLDGRRLTPDEKTGRITAPFTQQPGTRPIVLADAAGTFATLTSFEHHAEEYRLDAQFHIEREQLLARKEATLAVRASLLLGDILLPLPLLKDAQLTITSTTLDGIATTQEVKAPVLVADKIFTHTITIPDRLARIDVALSGKVEMLSKGGEKQNLSAGDGWEVNGIVKTEATNDAHLSRFGEGYVFELLGRNGEPITDQQVVFEFTHREFKRHETVALRTDDAGRIALAALPGVRAITAKIPNGRSGGWSLDTIKRTASEGLHGKSGDVIRVPWSGAEKTPLSLLEVRGGTFVRDATSAVVVVPGFLEIKGLTPGDYSLRVAGEDARTVAIRVTDAKPVQTWLLGASRHLEVRDPAPVQIQSVTAEGGTLVVKIANANPFTRIHVAASRFLPGTGIFGGLGDFTRFASGSALPAKLPSLFAAGREIGDEYRYILDRRYAKTFPGNMLTRPGLILNPWEKRTTDQQAITTSAMQQAAATAGGRAGAARERAKMQSVDAKAMVEGEQAGTDLDFLANASPALYNLVPDKDGFVRIDRKALGDRQHVQIYAEDLVSAVWRSVALAEVPTKFADLRLVRNLDPAKPFSEKKQVTVLAKGQSLTLADILTSEMETYDTLGGVFSLFTTLNHDENLAKFAWVLQWPTLKDEEKRAKYSEFACHELNFFLSRKDAAFFAKVVQPYLRNKKDKTFMDDYLIGADLRRYLEPWAFARLNAAERCLLAQRIPGESAATARHLRELWELLTPDPDRQDQLFETALRGRAMDQEASALGAEKEVILKEMRGMDAVTLSQVAAESAPAPAALMAPGLQPAAKASRYENSAGMVAEKLKADAPAEAEALRRSGAKDADRDGLSDKLQLNFAAEGKFWDEQALGGVAFGLVWLCHKVGMIKF